MNKLIYQQSTEGKIWVIKQSCGVSCKKRVPTMSTQHIAHTWQSL